MPLLFTLPRCSQSVLPSLHSTERRLSKDPERAETYRKEISELEQAGYVAQILPEEAEQSKESWFIPHHMVHHNGKDRIVFNCSTFSSLYQHLDHPCSVS